jgi:hypothetical protein
VSRQAPAPDDSQLAGLAAMWGANEISLVECRAARQEIVTRLQSAAPPPVRLPAWGRDDLRARWLGMDAAGSRGVDQVLIEAVLAHSSPDRRWHPAAARTVVALATTRSNVRS